MSARDSPRDEGVPPNAELAERLGRVEEQIDHQSEVLERIEERVAEDHDQLADRVDDMEPEHQRLWFTYQACKWVVVISSGSSVLATVVSVVLL